tara:strand:+ start:3919 stop:4089 length:171 start_codon:yes stop_codon:yes gene_type:complete
MEEALKLDYDTTYTKEIKQLALFGNDGIVKPPRYGSKLATLGRLIVTNISSIRVVF